MRASFVYDQPSIRVVFGAGSIDRLGDEARRLGVRRALVLATPGQRRIADETAGRLGRAAVGVFAEAVMHVPIETAHAGRAAAARLEADSLFAVGGGSTIGLAKAIALETGLPIVAVPTTYAGSEMTTIYGVTEAGIKKTGRDRRVLPKTVLYDAALTVTVPPRVSVTSGLNAMAHCVEALYARDGNPVISLLAAEGIRVLARALPVVADAPGNLDARSDALYAAWLAGTALGATSMGIHHKLCHALGGSFNLPHADVHAVILPHATAFNRDAASAAMRQIAEALGTPDAAQGIYDLAVRLGAPRTLSEIGMRHEDLDRAARLAVENRYDNPRAIEYEGVWQLLEDAFQGRRPFS
jgi:alcohol dehydrogenase class IV